MRKRLLAGFAILLTSIAAISIAPKETYSANESVIIGNWDSSSWRSNDSANSYKVAVRNNDDTATYYYDAHLGPGNVPSAVDAYLMGVLNRELIAPLWGNSANYLNGYKAQAIAARNMLLEYQRFNKDHGKTYDVWNNTHQQTDLFAGSTDPSNHLPSVMDNDVRNKVVIYQGSRVETTYSSTTRWTSIPDKVVSLDVTRRSEEWTGFYHPHLRNSLNRVVDERASRGGADIPYAESHSVGMSQHGAMYYSSYAQPRLNFEQILKHYFHPSPPFVREVIIKRSGINYYKATWEDRRTEFEQHRGEDFYGYRDIRERSADAGYDFESDSHRGWQRAYGFLERDHSRSERDPDADGDSVILEHRLNSWSDGELHEPECYGESEFHIGGQCPWLGNHHGDGR